MNLNIKAIPSSLPALARLIVTGIRRERFRARINQAFPGVHFEWPLQLVVDELDSLTIGTGSLIGPYSEIIVLKNSPFSTISGRLLVGDGVRIGMGANIRAAGGEIRIGNRTQIGQHVSIIGSNHYREKKTGAVCSDRWDESKTGVTIGENCWIGAGVIILPGVVIGDGSVVGAGSVVTRSIGENQLWFGNPAGPSSLPPS